MRRWRLAEATKEPTKESEIERAAERTAERTAERAVEREPDLVVVSNRNQTFYFNILHSREHLLAAFGLKLYNQREK